MRCFAKVLFCLAILCASVLYGISFWPSSSSMSDVASNDGRGGGHGGTHKARAGEAGATMGPEVSHVEKKAISQQSFDSCRYGVRKQLDRFTIRDGVATGHTKSLLEYFGTRTRLNNDINTTFTYVRGKFRHQPPQFVIYGAVTVQGIENAVRLVGTRYSLEWTLLEQLCRKDYGDLANMAFKHGDVVVDMGANIGLFSVLLALMHPKIRIIAYEASPLNALVAKENIRLNGLDNRVTLKNQAITGDGRDVKITSCVGRDRLSRIGGDCRGGRSINMTVSSTTFDKVLEDDSLTQIALFKLDCEGCECDVFPHIHAVQIRHAVGECHKSVSSTQCFNDCKQTLQLDE